MGVKKWKVYGEPFFCGHKLSFDNSNRNNRSAGLIVNRFSELASKEVCDYEKKCVAEHVRCEQEE